MEALKTHLNNYPEIKGAYFNAEGEWFFKKKPGCEYKTREEILGESKPKENTNGEGNQKDNKQIKKK